MPADSDPHSPEGAQDDEAHRAVLGQIGELDDPELMLPRVLSSLGDALGWDFAAAWLPELDDSLLTCAAAWERPGADVAAFREVTRRCTFEKGEGLPGRAWDAGAAHWVTGLGEGGEVPRAGVAAQAGLRTAVAVPLTVGETVEGVLEVVTREQREPDSEVIEFLSEAGHHVAHHLEWWHRHQALLRRERALSATGGGVVIADAGTPGFPVVYASQGFERLTGYSSEEAVGRSCSFLQGEGTDAAAIEEMSDALANGRSCRVTLRNYRKDGTVFWNEVSLSPVHDDEDRIVEYVGIQTDVTERVLGAQRLRMAESRYRSLVEQIPAITYMAEFTESATLTYLSPQIEGVLGYAPDEFLGDDELWYECIHPEDRDCVIAEERRTFEERESFDFEYRMVSREGRTVWMRERDRIIFDDRGEPVFTQGVLFDITALKDAESALRDEQRRAQRYFELAGTMLVALDPEGRVSEVNRKGCEVLGYDEAELVGADWIAKVVAEPDRPLSKEAFLASGDVGPVERFEVHVVTRSGAMRTIAWRTVPLWDENAELIGTLSSGEDVTDRRDAETRMSFLAYHDDLTGLPNRTLLEEHLDLALRRAERTGGAVALLYADLDNFKLVNDSLGHSVGDEVLRLCASRLRRAARASDLLARQGGDEFLMLLTDIEDDGAQAARRVARQLAAAFDDPFTLGGADFRLGASVGISLFPADADSAETLLQHADSAMYEAKRLGRGGFAVYSGSPRDSVDRLSMTAKLRRGLDADELELHYQPIYRLADGVLAGLEALVRWRQPDGTLVAPDDFIPLAEDTGLIEPVGEWVLEALFSQAHEWGEAGLWTPLSVNVSPRQLRQRHLAGALKRLLDAYGVHPSRIALEITETAAMAEGDQTRSLLEELSGLGVKLALDDLGAGYSSLAMLRELPLSMLKIDRSFLRDVPEVADAASVVEAILQLADAVGMASVAEGIETAEQLSFLRERGCVLGQGFHLARPMPVDAATELMREQAQGPARR